MPREKKYTAHTLEMAARRYFDGISRVREVTEMVPTGALDKYGHPVMKAVPVLNRRGQKVTVTEFVEPPTVGGLCAALGISRQTWANYCDSTIAEVQAVTDWIQDTLRTWNERELLTREGRNIQGIVFNLQNNYGYSEKKQVSVEGGGVEALLRELDDGGI